MKSLPDPSRPLRAASQPPRDADRGLAADQRESLQVSDASELAAVETERLAAPHGPVGSVAGSVPGKAKRRTLEAMLGEARGNVRVMMLHADQGNCEALRQILADSSRRIVRMQIAGEKFGDDIEQAQQLVDRAQVGRPCFGAMKVAEMLTESYFGADRESDRILLMGSQSQCDWPVGFDPNRQRSVSARAAENFDSSIRSAGDGVVERARDRAVVDEEQVGNIGEPRERLAIVDADWFVREIAAGAYHRPVNLVEQKPMQRRVGNHDAEPRVLGRDIGDYAGSRTAAQNHDRRGGAGKNPQVVLRKVTAGSYRRDIRHHEREWLGASFARAQSGHGRRIGGIDD
jgi:hypothetical protein